MVIVEHMTYGDPPGVHQPARLWIFKDAEACVPRYQCSLAGANVQTRIGDEGCDGVVVSQAQGSAMTQPRGNGQKVGSLEYELRSQTEVVSETWCAMETSIVVGLQTFRALSEAHNGHHTTEREVTRGQSLGSTNPQKHSAENGGCPCFQFKSNRCVCTPATHVVALHKHLLFRPGTQSVPLVGDHRLSLLNHGVTL